MWLYKSKLSTSEQRFLCLANCFARVMCVIIFTWSNFFHWTNFRFITRSKLNFLLFSELYESYSQSGDNQLLHWASSLPFTYIQLCIGETSAIDQISPLWFGRKWLIMHYPIYYFWDSFDLEVKHTIILIITCTKIFITYNKFSAKESQYYGVKRSFMKWLSLTPT